MDGITLFQVTAKFQITAPTNIDDDAIKERIKGLLAKAGIDSTLVIEVLPRA